MVYLSACGPSADDGPVDVVIIGQPDSLFDQGIRLSPAAQHLRSATHEGLVAFDPSGQIVPAVAERWIVTDDGLSYIFRLRNSAWADGEQISAADVRLLLRDTFSRLEGTSLGLDLAKVVEVRAMTGRVIEIRLSSPMPEFLRVLAQPELGFVKSGNGVGPMILSRDEELSLGRLSALPPEERGLPAREDWQDVAKMMTIQAMSSEAAVAAFSGGDADILLNGQLASFPSAQLGPLSRGNIRVDPALGLFGFAIRSGDGLLGSAERREALSMAIDRDALIQPFGLQGWRPTSWIVPPQFLEASESANQRWPSLSIDQRRAVAARRISAWRAETGESATLRISLPSGSGSDLLFDQVQSDWGRIGIDLERVAMGQGAELELRDRLARYSSPRWYLNQFNCELEIGLCSEAADELVRQSLTVRNPSEKARLLSQAHDQMITEEVFIPLGAPVRWSLVRGTIAAYQPNPWGVHPLFPLSQPTI